MLPARVLVIDDSVVVRKFLSTIIASEALLELAGTAATASIGLQKIAQCNPDIVLMDVEMPEMDGIEAAARTRRDWPKLPILMCSAMTERGASVTFRALAAGATDYVAKPSSLAEGNGLEQFKRELADKLKALTHRVSCATLQPLASRAGVFATKPEAVVLGCSTGGPNALHGIFASLPATLAAPVLVVQHMPPVFTRMLAERLGNHSKLKVTEATHGERPRPGSAYLAPGGFHLSVARDANGPLLVLDQAPLENSCRPAVDVLFRSAAKVYGDRLVGAVLTGMGRDGTLGARAIVDAGGQVVVQDSQSCVVASMPASVVAAGLASAVVPLDTFGAWLTARAGTVR